MTGLTGSTTAGIKTAFCAVFSTASPFASPLSPPPFACLSASLFPTGFARPFLLYL